MTDLQSTATPAPTRAELAALDPVACARRITEYGRTRGNLPPWMARLRARKLLEARVDEGRKVAWLALEVGIAGSGISRLTKPELVEGVQP